VARLGFGLFRERTNLLDVLVIECTERRRDKVLADNAVTTRHRQCSGGRVDSGLDPPLLDPESEQSLAYSGEFGGLFEAVHGGNSTTSPNRVAAYALSSGGGTVGRLASDLVQTCAASAIVLATHLVSSSGCALC